MTFTQPRDLIYLTLKPSNLCCWTITETNKTAKQTLLTPVKFDAKNTEDGGTITTVLVTRINIQTPSLRLTLYRFWQRF